MRNSSDNSRRLSSAFVARKADIPKKGNTGIEGTYEQLSRLSLPTASADNASSSSFEDMHPRFAVVNDQQYTFGTQSSFAYRPPAPLAISSHTSEKQSFSTGLTTRPPIWFTPSDFHVSVTLPSNQFLSSIEPVVEDTRVFQDGTFNASNFIARVHAHSVVTNEPPSSLPGITQTAPFPPEALLCSFQPFSERTLLTMPALIQPALTQPALTQPALVQPVLGQPALIQPALTQPILDQVPLSFVELLAGVPRFEAEKPVSSAPPDLLVQANSLVVSGKMSSEPLAPKEVRKSPGCCG